MALNPIYKVQCKSTHHNILIMLTWNYWSNLLWNYAGIPAINYKQHIVYCYLSKLKHTHTHTHTHTHNWYKLGLVTYSSCYYNSWERFLVVIFLRLYFKGMSLHSSCPIPPFYPPWSTGVRTPCVLSGAASFSKSILASLAPIHQTPDAGYASPSTRLPPPKKPTNFCMSSRI